MELSIAPRDAIGKIIADRRLRFRFMRHDSWENALFVHWPVDPDILRRELPSGLEPDLLDGSAWIGLVLLTETAVSVTPAAGRKFAPKIDHLGANVRTYVRNGDVPGIYFFSLECSSVFASLGARAAGIPYFPASMSRTVDIERPLDRLHRPEEDKPMLESEPNSCCHNSDFVFKFTSERWSWERPAVHARWHLLTDKQAADINESVLERGRWFVERYSVYAAWPLGCGPVLLRGDVEHPCWSLQPAVVEKLDASGLLKSAGFPELASAAAFDDIGEASVAPHVCFSRGVGPVDFWMLEPV